MSILNNIGKRVSNTAKTAAKRSGDIVESTKLNMSIAAEEDKIKKVYYDLGETLYDLFKVGQQVPESAKKDCETIQSIELNIEEIKQRILELRDVKACPDCGTELHVEMQYCHKCGQKQEVLQHNIENDESPAVEAQEEEYEVVESEKE